MLRQFIYRIAVEIIYPFFSTPMTAATFASNILEQAKLTNDQVCNHVTAACDPMMDWDFRNIAGQEVYQVSLFFNIFMLQKSGCSNLQQE